MRKILSITLSIFILTLCLAGCANVEAPPTETPPMETPTEAPPTETPPEEKPPVSTGEKPDFGPLSNDIYSFQIEIDGEVYQFPMTYAQFTAYGWVYAGDDTQTLDSYFRSTTNVFKMGSLQCYTEIVNFDISARPFKECYVGGLSIDDYMVKDTGAKVVLPGGVELNAATAEQAKEIYGTPSYENTTDAGTTTIEYELESYRKVRLAFDSDTKLLYDIDVQNLKEPDDFQASEASGETPNIVSKYTDPAALTDDFAAFVVEYGGDLYEIPAPVGKFVQNGWQVMEGGEDEVVSGRDTAWVTMMKDNQKLRVMVQNYSENATTMKNCFVLTLKAGDSDNKTSIKISKGITIGMSQSDLEKALSGQNFEKDDSGSSYAYYEVMPLDNKVDTYEIYVDKETGEVYKIEADFQPRFADYTAR